MGSYFCGWYYRCQSDQHTLAVIPSLHRTPESNFCMIQLITDTDAFQAVFPYSAFRKDGPRIRIAKNCFGPSGIHLNLCQAGFRVAGDLHFGPFAPLRYDIMGPFQYLPLMQCRHSISSMRHTVDGTLTVNGMAYVFQHGAGYLEGDRGRSFPKKYLWTCSNVPNGTVMLSVAEIPLGLVRFTGVIGVVLLNGKEYRLASYLGARAVSIQPQEIVIRQGSLCLTVRRHPVLGHPLRAPVSGFMRRTIHEHPSCVVFYHFEDQEQVLLDYHAPNASFEYEY